MRQIFSVRFFAAVGTVAGLLFVLITVFTAKRAIVEEADPAAPFVRRIELVDQVAGASSSVLAIDPVAGVVVDTTLVLDPSRQMVVKSGTPGVDYCGRLAVPGACAVVADLLGEAVVWFALVPMGTGRTVALPAVDVLDDGFATLVNGWQLPHAPSFDRRCTDIFESYRQFKQVFGDDFVTLYDLDDRRLSAVVCRQRVDYAPAAPPAAG